MQTIRSQLVALLATAALASPLGAQQTGTITGRVLNSVSQRPLSTVTIAVASRSVQSGSDGRFTLTGVPAGTYELRASLVGYTPAIDTVTVLAGQTVTVELTMQAAAVQLAELVVVGYGEQQKRDVTGVVAEVSTEQFNPGRIIAPEDLIKAKVAGVQVTEANGGEPGGGISMRIRGSTSVTSSSEPLYVIDGIPMPVGGGLSAGRNPMNFLNPNDIESFTVLKDASATAIYGSQGANGVVMITTKSGKGAVPESGWRLSYRGTVSGSSITAGPAVLTADQFRQVVEEKNPTMAAYLGTATTDWNQAVEQSAFGQEHMVALTGGGERTTLRASFGYLGQEGVIQASKNERLSLNVAFDQLLFNDRLSVKANVMGSQVKDKFTPGGVLSNASQFDPTQPIYDSTSPYGGYFEWDASRTNVNPVAIFNRETVDGTTYRSLGNVSGEYAAPFLEGLKATAQVGYLVTNSSRREFYPSTDKNQINRGLYGTVSRSSPSEYGTLFNGFLTYDRQADRHAFNVTGGYAYTYGRQDSPYFYAQNLASDLLGPNGIPAAVLQQTSLNVTESKLASWFARANYSLDDKYLLTASIRTDGSSKFGAGNQWATFPSAAVAWRMSEESFMQGGMFSDLKLRLSWGKNGNSAFDSYRQYKTYTLGDPQATAQFGDTFMPTIRPSATDPNIKWEATSSWNIGLDYGLWNNRVTGALDFYTKETKDLIFDVIVAAGTNLSNSLLTNVGTMNNKGIEFTVNALIVESRSGGFSWDANFNFWYNKNNLVEINPFARGSLNLPWGPYIAGGVGTQVEVLQPGSPVGSFYVFEHKRDASGKPIYEDTNGDGVINEQDLYVDQPTECDNTGACVPDGVINQNDRRAYHNPNPDWVIGHTSQFRYKSLDASFTVLAEIGNYMYNNVASSTGYYGRLGESDRPTNFSSSVLENNFEAPQYQSDVYVENASFLRLQNIEVGYTFRGALNGMRLFGVVQNLFTITGYSGLDPISTNSGIDNNIYPRSRTFVGGLNVTF